ncbi:hypothetical protein TNCV_4809251 [Trichonephila clavipes]|nr:hypothetical protein TNCV_4809251 [Trichonephila clavipes]
MTSIISWKRSSKPQVSLPVVQISMLIPRNLLTAKDIRILQTRLKKIPISGHVITAGEVKSGRLLIM